MYDDDQKIDPKKLMDRIKQLSDQLTEAQLDNELMKAVIKKNGLEDELPQVDLMSSEERICVSGIKNLEKFFVQGNIVIPPYQV